MNARRSNSRPFLWLQDSLVIVIAGVLAAGIVLVTGSPTAAAEQGRLLYWNGIDWMTMDPSGGAKVNVTNESPTSSNGLSISAANFSPDGSRIAFGDMSGNRIVHTATDGTSKQVVAQNEALQPSVGENRSPFWSPGGDQLAYFTSRNSRWDLWISPADGSGRGAAFHPVTPNGASGTADLHGDWSPANDRLAYSFALILEEGLTTILDSDGTVVSTFPGLWPSFSPDGSLLATINPTTATLEFRDRDGSNVRTTAIEAAWPQWSPDGDRLVASSLDGDIMTMAADGSDLRVVLDDGNVNIRPDWGQGQAPVIADGPSGPYTGVTGIDGEVVRGYRAVFGRLPDRSGFEYWVDRRAGGMALVDVVNSFTLSAEFEQRFGPTLRDGSTIEWVHWIYQQVLGRTADSAGHAYWVGRVDRGEITRAGLIVHFSESSEYRVITGTN